MLSKLKADVAAVKAYVVEHYKQLAAAVVAGKYLAGPLAGLVVALVAYIAHKL